MKLRADGVSCHFLRAGGTKPYDIWVSCHFLRAGGTKPYEI